MFIYIWRERYRYVYILDAARGKTCLAPPPHQSVAYNDNIDNNHNNNDDNSNVNNDNNNNNNDSHNNDNSNTDNSNTSSTSMIATRETLNDTITYYDIRYYTRLRYNIL